MIKGVVLDVDGVLVGGKKGYNWPQPHPDVMAALTGLRKDGLIVSLCTGKGTFAIGSIVDAAHLDNAHVGDGGAIVLDVIHHAIIDAHYISGQTAVKVLTLLLAHDIYTEVYTVDGYFVQKNLVSDITRIHGEILYKQPVIVESLPEAARAGGIVKIMPIARDGEQKKGIISLLHPYAGELTLQWGVHPTALPHQFGIVTALGVSKQQAVEYVAARYGLEPADLLGVGDSMTDWEFMKICGYAGVMGNAPDELKNAVRIKGANGYIGASVDENGVLDIFRHFKLRTL